MIQLAIKWKSIYRSTCQGVVQVYDSDSNEYLGEWGVEVRTNSICQFPQGSDRVLPPIQRLLSEKVDRMARIYHDGLNGKENSFTWLQPNEGI